MNMRQLGDNRMLTHLSLARCRMRIMSGFTFENLHSLDLSDNMLTEVAVHHFEHMPQLTVLFLTSNLLTSVFPVLSTSGTELRNIKMLDLSHVRMHSVDPSLLKVFPRLLTFNLSHSGAELLQWNSSHMSAAPLQELDLRGCKTDMFPRELLKGFLHLRRLHTDNFKLCCPAVLPSGFNTNQCHVRPDHVSSCDNLLGSVTYRTAVVVLATLALLGNTVSLVVRVCVGSTWRLSSGGVVLTHLSVADLGMGLYLVTLGVADRLLAGHYVWQDDSWRKGAVCHLAGVIALSCRLATTFFTTVLTIDRCLHRCLSLTQSLTPSKVNVVCVVVWISCVLLATVPLTQPWQFFGKQALCFPLPHNRNNSLDSHYAYTVMVLVHLILLILCCICEVVSGMSSKVRESISMNRASCLKEIQYVMLGLLTSGLLYIIACLVPTDSHTDRQKTVHTALVYFVSVVSCAMDPYLHLYGVRSERNKRIKEERLLRIVSRSRV